jgi:hypothetical protein
VYAGKGASIYWGNGSRDYSEDRRQLIRGTEGDNNHQTEIADLNKDGWLDIVFAADKGADVMIFWGDPKCRYDETNRDQLEVGAKTMTIADVDQDGWLDLVCPIYKIGGQRTLPSFVLLGGEDGYSINRKISLMTDGATGSIVSDFNFDGFADIFYFCHRTDGDSDEIGKYADHKTDSRLYWGSRNGFSEDNYLRLPAVGSHYDVGMDIGDISEREFIWEYTSSPYDAGNQNWGRITWEAVTPGATSVRFQVRSAASLKGLDQAEWVGPLGPGSYFTESGAGLPNGESYRWVQYKILFDTVNGATSPVVSSVQISFP